MDQNKKTMRHFYCRDALWETFEGMANDFDCSIDYLINEAMRLYARSKNYQVPAAGGSPSQIMPASGTSGPRGPAAIATPSTPALRSTSPHLSSQPGVPRPATSPSLTTTRPPPTVPPVTTPRIPPPLPTPSMPPSMPLATPPTPPPASSPGLSSAPLGWTPPLATPPPQSQSQSSPGGSESGGPLLYLVFNGQRIVVDKEQFVIGRGSKTADLAIKDGNISRKHAVVLRRNGVFYIKDLGSTNGIEYKGMRIDNKRIDEGDVFFICDYELKFTYQP